MVIRNQSAFVKGRFIQDNSMLVCNTLIFNLGTLYKVSKINFARLFAGCIRFLFNFFNFRTFTVNYK
jgi:hypothetical protein